MLKFEPVEHDEWLAIIHPGQMVKFKIVKGSNLVTFDKKRALSYYASFLARKFVDEVGRVDYEVFKNRLDVAVGPTAHVIDVAGKDEGVISEVSLAQ